MKKYKPKCIKNTFKSLYPMKSLKFRIFPLSYFSCEGKFKSNQFFPILQI